ncbi:MAG TPA: hypothetical protein VL495_01570 [Edaphobacter sp.]|nr:hypothetical protein [Edaphobacter sp.]
MIHSPHRVILSEARRAQSKDLRFFHPATIPSAASPAQSHRQHIEPLKPHQSIAVVQLRVAIEPPCLCCSTRIAISLPATT